MNLPFKTKRSKDILLFVLALAVLLFAVLRPVGKKVIPEITAPTLTFVHHWEGREALVAALIAEYEEQHNAVTIVQHYLPYETLKAKLTGPEGDNGSAGDDDSGPAEAAFSPDIVAVDPAWIPQLSETTTILPETFSLLRFFYPLYYNIEILKEAGMSRPPKTHSEFLAQARAVIETQSETGTYAIAAAANTGAEGGGDPRGLYPWIFAAGNLSGPAIQETLDFLSAVRALNNGPADSRAESSAPAEAEKRSAFLNRETAFYIGSAEDMELLEAGLGRALGYTAVPAPDSYTGKPVFCGGGWSAAVFGASPHPEEARAFAEYLYEQSARLAGFWALPEKGSPTTVDNDFYTKARELYTTGDLVADPRAVIVAAAETNAAIAAFLDE